MLALARFDMVVDHSTIPTVAIFELMALLRIENEQPAAPLVPPTPLPPPPLPLHAKVKRTIPSRVNTNRAPRNAGISVAAYGTRAPTRRAMVAMDEQAGNI